MNLSYQEHWTFYGHIVPGEPFYGLYEPSNDAFFAVNRNLQALQEVSLLFSGRFTLYVCDLTDAVNTVIKHLDNTNCANWTVGSKENFNVTRFVDLNKLWYIPSALPACLPKLQNFEQDQQYIIAACFWIGSAIPRILERYNNDTQYTQILNKLSEAVNAPFPAPHLGVTEQIREIIFSEFDYNKAKPQIDRLLAPYYG
ncbi:hypothetical protein [Flavobacterium sp.]|jgi:hypothetical protein|uniref:hypothetical protein n=1 Tax=Flavobacterium sp. TaxID=239 RepID=UPI0037BE8183